jgi:hypothetical protein
VVRSTPAGTSGVAEGGEGSGEPERAKLRICKCGARNNGRIIVYRCGRSRRGCQTRASDVHLMHRDARRETRRVFLPSADPP